MENKFCHNCGSKLPSEAKFCINCGAKSLGQQYEVLENKIDNEATQIPPYEFFGEHTQPPIEQNEVTTGPEPKKLAKCSVCGREIAKSEKTCPSCGAKNERPMKKMILIAGIVVMVVVVAALVCFFVRNKTVEISMGRTYTVDGVSFTLNDFCFAERTDGETYDPNMIDGIAFAPNDGYVFAYINYTIENGGNETFDHFMDLDLFIEYDGKHIYGDSQLDYKATCTETDKYNLDIAPLKSKTYHHVVTNFPVEIAESLDARYGINGSNPWYQDYVHVVAKLNGKTVKVIIPCQYLVINKGQNKPETDIPFTEADAATKQFVSGILMQNTYAWQDGNIDCQLTFDSTQAQLTQNMAGTNFVSTGEYVIGTDKIKVNYGGGDVFYGWTKNGDSIDLYLIE